MDTFPVPVKIVDRGKPLPSALAARFLAHERFLMS